MISGRRWATRAAVAAAALAAARGAPAQSARVADSLLQTGALARAESLYYAAVGRRPGDAAARVALGRYLVARGAIRVGAILFEEAIRFGGDAASIGRELAPVYLSMGEYHLLAALGAASPQERDRAKWLVAHETRTIAPDSLVTVPFRPSRDSAGVGHVTLRVNGRPLDAVVSARVHGVAISDGAAAPLRLHVFVGPNSGDRDAGVLAAADSVAIGALAIRNVAVHIAHLDDAEPAAVGLDMLGRFAVTFDPRASRLVLRVSGAAPASLSGDRFATLMSASDLRVLQAGTWMSLGRAPFAQLLHDRRWTFDGKHGQIVVER